MCLLKRLKCVPSKYAQLFEETHLGNLLNCASFKGFSWLTSTQSTLDLRTFVAKPGKSQFTPFLGALFAQIWWEGPQKHFKGPGCILWYNSDKTIKMAVTIVSFQNKKQRDSAPWYLLGIVSLGSKFCGDGRSQIIYTFLSKDCIFVFSALVCTQE